MKKSIVFSILTRYHEANISWTVIWRYEDSAHVAPQLLYGPASILTLYGTWYANIILTASLGQTITTHQGKQLGVTKISSPCDGLPMFGLLQPNLTHFVHTNEEN